MAILNSNDTAQRREVASYVHNIQRQADV